MIRFRPVSKEKEKFNIEEISKHYGINPILATILIDRNINIDEILNDVPLNDPFMLNDMDKCVECINYHLKNNNRIIIYGDYDADGVTSTSILYMYLKSVGADVGYFIPDRHTFGYGLSTKAIDVIGNPDLIITVDCGITNLEEAKYIKDKGIDLIITDHHQLLEKLPECNAVVNPLIGEYPFKLLCGCGVALKVVEALGGPKEMEKYIDLAAIATVADLVSLTGENRTIVKKGLEKINSNPRQSIRALLSVSGIKDKVEAGHIAFSIAPRINSAGRLEKADVGVELFASEDYGKSIELSNKLNESNKERQRQENEILKDAISIIESRVDLATQRIIVLSSDKWNKGVVGIVASKLVEIYNRPVIVFCEEDGICVGSGRSINGIHLFNLINYFGEYLIKYGGHEMAAGMSIQKEKLNDFKKSINEYVFEHFEDELFIPSINYDLKIKLKDISLSLISDLNKLSPMGMGNRTPVFLLENIKLLNPTIVGGSRNHFKVNVVDNEYSIDGIAFSLGSRIGEIKEENKYDIVCTIDKNSWNGCDRPQILIKEFKKNISSNIENLISTHSQDYFESLITGYGIETQDNFHKKIRQMYRGEVYIQRRVKKDVLGTAIYTSIPRCSRELLNMLKKNDLLDNVDVCIKEPVNNTCVVIAPNFNRYILNHSRLVIYDYAPSGFIKKVIENNPKIDIVLCNNDFINNTIRDFIISNKITRDKAIEKYVIFKNIIKVYHNKETIINMFCKCANETKFNGILYFEVFKEIGIICDENGKITVNNDKADFENSEIKNIFNDLERKIFEDIEILLNNCKKRYK